MKTASETNTEPTVTHTPTPWRVRDLTDEVLELGAEPSGWVDIRSGETTIGSVYGGDLAANRADAALIVKAANAHATLVELLEDVKQACLFADDFGGIGVTTEPYIEPELFGAICAALKELRNE